MQAVILAAGRGVRMGTLTENMPKPLLKTDAGTLLSAKLALLPGIVDEIIIVIGYRGNQIREAVGEVSNGIPVKYVEQTTLDGTAGALWCARNQLHERFLVLMGDDIYDAADITALAALPDWAFVVQHLECIEHHGRIRIENGLVGGIEPQSTIRGEGGYAYTGLCLLDTRIFDHVCAPAAPDSVEYGLPQTALAASRDSGIPIHIYEAREWTSITTPQDLEALTRR